MRCSPAPPSRGATGIRRAPSSTPSTNASPKSRSARAFESFRNEPRTFVRRRPTSRAASRAHSGNHQPERPQPPLQRIEAEAEFLERDHAEETRIAAAPEDHSGGSAAILDLEERPADVPLHLPAIREPEGLADLRLDADCPQDLSRNDRVDRPRVDGEDDIDRPLDVPGVEESTVHRGDAHASTPSQSPGCQAYGHTAMPKPGRRCAQICAQGL